MINPTTLLTRRPTILSSVSFSFLFLSFSALSFGRGTGPASFSNGRKIIENSKIYGGSTHAYCNDRYSGFYNLGKRVLHEWAMQALQYDKELNTENML